MDPEKVKAPDQETIVKYVIKCLDPSVSRQYSSYGYDIYLPNVMREWLKDNGIKTQVEPHINEVSDLFYDSAWELCRLGVLRPGIRKWDSQATVDGSAGNGYSVTPFGRSWLDEKDKNIYIPTEPDRFSEMLSPYSKLFGPGFHERAYQAIRCYGAHAYLACCVMCGAASESILLHLAIQKKGNEEEVLKLYRAANGRSRLENLLVGKISKTIKNEFEICFGLLKYWRDEASHGCKSEITENEAYTSLALLLRSSMFVKENKHVLLND